MPKFTFKTEKSTGAWGSFYPDTIHVKLYGYEVGYIDDTSPHKIRLQVKRNSEEITKESPSPFKWIKLKKEFSSIAEAKEHINKPETQKFIFDSFEIYCEE